MIKVVCDRCGAEIRPGKIGYVALNFRDTPDGTLMKDNPFEKAHFCLACMDGISDFIINPGKSEKTKETAKEEPAKAAAPKPDNAAKPRRRIDYGKIMALHNAGWSNVKIADEMGMNRTAVAQAIYMYKKKHEAAGEAKASEAD